MNIYTHGIPYSIFLTRILREISLHGHQWWWRRSSYPDTHTAQEVEDWQADWVAHTWMEFARDFVDTRPRDSRSASSNEFAQHVSVVVERKLLVRLRRPTRSVV